MVREILAVVGLCIILAIVGMQATDKVIDDGLIAPATSPHNNMGGWHLMGINRYKPDPTMQSKWIERRVMMKEVERGCLVRVSTVGYRTHSGEVTCAEAITFVPGATIEEMK